MNLTRRRQARELSLQILFQLEFSKEINIEASLKHFKSHFEAHDDVYDYAYSIVNGTVENKDKVDSIIKEKAINWGFDRIALVDKNILRLAIYELLFSENQVPPVTSVDEALDIAKKYSTTDSHQFINGILDSIIKENNLT